MFESNMKERMSGIVEIKDTSPEIFGCLLNYIYTGNTPDFDSYDTLALGVFVAADKYQLGKLKELCELRITANIDLENCINLLVLGHLHQAPTLKVGAVKFVSQNMDKINSNDWEKALIDYPTLFAEVIKMMLPRKNESETCMKMEKRERIAK